MSCTRAQAASARRKCVRAWLNHDDLRGVNSWTWESTNRRSREAFTVDSRLVLGAHREREHHRTGNEYISSKTWMDHADDSGIYVRQDDDRR